MVFVVKVEQIRKTNLRRNKDLLVEAWSSFHKRTLGESLSNNFTCRTFPPLSNDYPNEQGMLDG